MRYIIGSFSIIIAIIIVIGIFASLRKPSKPIEQTVMLPKFLLWIGIICSVTFLIPTVITLLLNGSAVLMIGFFLFSLLGCSLIIGYFNCRITYNEETFAAKNFCGFKHTYAYSEIMSMYGKMDVKLYVGKRVVRLDVASLGKDEFLSFARKQYRKLNNGKAIPIVVPKSDIFNGNVEQAGEFIFIYVLIGLLCVGMIVFFAVLSIPNTAEDLDYASLSFDQYETQDGELLLYANGDSKYYSIPAYQELLPDADEFIALCDTSASFDVGYVFYDKADTPYYGLESIVGNDGTVYLTMDAVHEYKFKDAWIFYLFFGGFILIWSAFVALSIYVGRHPEKFSRRFIRLFFKDGYVRMSSNKRG